MVDPVPDQLPGRLPIFPLNTVMFPGVSLPLHIFEDRYRALVTHLLQVDDAAERVFGIVAIREGYEVGSHEARSLYRVGCLVQISEVTPYDDGRYDLVVVGRSRFRVMSSDAAGAFVTAEVEPLPPEPNPGPSDHESAARTLAAFEEYRRLLSDLRGGSVLVGSMPTDPELLSYTLAATCLLTLPQRQHLLEAPTSVERLQQLRQGLRDEMRAMRAVPSLPATEVARSGWSPN